MAALMPPGGAKPGDVVTSVVLQPRSLLFFGDEAYTSHLHGIDQVRGHAQRHPPSFRILSNHDNSNLCSSAVTLPQVSTDVIDDTVCNAHACGMRRGAELVRPGERVSLTVRRVERVMPRLLRL